MPKKKKKKSRIKKKRFIKKRNKIRRKSYKRKKTKKKSSSRKKTSKKKVKFEDSSSSELIIKTKPEWIKASLANKAQYQKNISSLLKTIILFGKKRVKE